MIEIIKEFIFFLKENKIVVTTHFFNFMPFWSINYCK